MWKYLSGVTKPEKRKVDTRESNKVYDETKRKRSFQPHWKNVFQWLQFDEETQLMSCEWCQKFGKDDPEGKFIKGTDNFKKDTLDYHNGNQIHKRSEAILKASIMPSTSQSKAGEIITSLNVSVVDKLKIMFNSCHALVLANRPFTDYVWMMELHRKNGLDIGNTYLNDKAAGTFIHYISETERLKIKEEVASAKFISLISDGSTDCSIKEQEILYLRYALAGVVNNKFIGVRSVEKADASHILDAITVMMRDELDIEPDQWYKKIVGFGSDGASVMVGKNAGVVAKLKENQPCIQGVHCYAHRLELAYKDAMKNIKMYENFNQLLITLYYFYHNSPLNRSNLVTSFKSLGQTSIMPSRAGGTRWVSHQLKAIENVITGYSAIVNHLSQVAFQKGASANAIGKAKFCHKLLVDPCMMTFAHLMHDVLNVLSKLSLTFQSHSATLFNIHLKVEASQKIIMKYKTKDGPKLREVNGDCFQSLKLPVMTDRKQFCSARNKICENLDECLSNRFADANEKVLHSVKVASFFQWPLDISTDEEFGDEDIANLVDHFKVVLIDNGISTSDVEMEWVSLRTEIYKCSKDVKVQDLNWSEVNKTFGKSDNFRNILGLMDLVAALPASSAIAEQGFSIMKQAKNDWRSRLQSEKMTEIMRVKIHSPSVKDFDPKPAIDLWNSSATRGRRVDQQPYGQRENEENDDENESEESDYELEPEDK